MTDPEIRDGINEQRLKTATINACDMIKYYMNIMRKTENINKWSNDKKYSTCNEKVTGLN